MAQITLLDIAKRNNSDREIGLIEDVATFAPEVAVLPARPINGVSFKSTLRTNYPTSAFRATGSGATLVKSTYQQKIAECFFLDTPLQVDESIPDAEDKSVGDVLADEVQGAMSAAGIALGSQLYYGTAADSGGFQGLVTFVGTTSSLNVDAAGTASVTMSAWLVYLDTKGVHFVVGRTAAGRGAGDPNQPSGEPAIIAPPFRMPEWSKQQVAVGTAGKVAMAYVTNISGWIGLAYGSNYSAFRVRNISLASAASYMTDARGALLLSKVPLHIRNSGRLRWFMNRDAAYSLQATRATSTVNTQALANGNWGVGFPTECQGIPITITDSLTSTETAS